MLNVLQCLYCRKCPLRVVKSINETGHTLLSWFVPSRVFISGFWIIWHPSLDKHCMTTKGTPFHRTRLCVREFRNIINFVNIGETFFVMHDMQLFYFILFFYFWNFLIFRETWCKPPVYNRRKNMSRFPGRLIHAARKPEDTFFSCEVLTVRTGKFHWLFD